MFAALTRASQAWRRVFISEFEMKQIQELRVELDAEFNARNEQAKPSASRSHISSKRGT